MRNNSIPFVLVMIAGMATGVDLAATLGCADKPPKLPEPTKEQKEVFADVTFKGQLLECTDPTKYKSESEMDACATAVVVRWGKDGGK